MAEQTIVNKKADSFEKYLKDNNLNFFTRFDKGDENQTVLFLTGPFTLLSVYLWDSILSRKITVRTLNLS